jgi:uncharacterized protein YggE
VTTIARLVLATPFLAATLFAVPAQAQDGDESNAIDDTPHITIVGTARAEVAPNLATITLGVVTSLPTARGASEANAKTTQAVIAAAKAQGIGSADIATQSVTLTQTFDELHDDAGRFTGRKPSGYEATNTLAVRVRDLGKVGALAQSLIESGANRFDGIGFSVEHPEPMLDRLAAEAVRNARRQAQLAADAAGVKLGRVLLIERPSADRPTQPVMYAARMKTAAPAIPVEAGTSELETTMEVTWAIAP